jgi:hypothetical protein
MKSIQVVPSGKTYVHYTLDVECDGEVQDICSIF